MDTATYKINPDRLHTLRAILDKMNRRAAKLGITGVAFTIGELQTTITKHAAPRKDEVFAWHDATLTIEPIKLAGWTFIATLDHTSEAGVVLRGVPGEVIPTMFRDSKATCDHCGFTRTRKETFVVRHDDGTFKQVGRQCVRDFLGVDPTHAARMAEFAISIGEAMDEAGDFTGAGGARYTSLTDYLYAVSVAMRQDGWLSRKAARDFNGTRTATADVAFMILYPGQPDNRTAAEKLAAEPTAADMARADLAIEWARNLRADGRELNDYEHNLAVVAGSEVITYKTAGIAASMLPSYLRHAGQEVERRKAAAVSQHVGTIGKREIFAALTVLFTKEIAGDYGVTTICTFADAAGNRIKWFASKEVEFSVGDVVSIKATVKAHGEWNSIKETTVTRAAIVGPAPGAQDAEGWGGDIPKA